MSSRQKAIYIVCSPRQRVGKTLIARALTEFILADGRAAIAFDLNPNNTALYGFLPRTLRTVLLLRIRGVDSLRFFTLLSPFQLLRICTEHGLGVLSLRPRQIPAAMADYPWQDRGLIAAYRLASGLWLVRNLLVLIGPAFELVLVSNR